MLTRYRASHPINEALRLIDSHYEEFFNITFYNGTKLVEVRASSDLVKVLLLCVHPCNLNIYIKIIKILLQDENPNRPDKFFVNGLYVAAMTKPIEVMQVLIEEGNGNPFLDNFRVIRNIKNLKMWDRYDYIIRRFSNPGRTFKPKILMKVNGFDIKAIGNETIRTTLNSDHGKFTLDLFPVRKLNPKIKDEIYRNIYERNFEPSPVLDGTLEQYYTRELKALPEEKYALYKFIEIVRHQDQV